MSERILFIFPTACFPFAVLEPLVDMLAIILPSALTASNSKSPPELKESLLRKKRCSYLSGIHTLRIQFSTDN